MTDKEVVVLVGTDSFLMEREVLRLKKDVLTTGVSSFNFDSFSAKTDPVAVLLDNCQLLPMMGERRLVLVREADSIKKEDFERWIDYFEKPSPSTLLVLVADKIDQRLKLWRVASDRGCLHTLKVPYPKEMPSWLRREAGLMGVEIDDQASLFLADLVGSSPTLGAGELEKLQTFIAPRTRINVGDVETLCLGGISKNIFDLADTVGARHFDKASALLDELALRGEPYVRILFMMTRHFRLLFLAKEAISEGRSQTEIAKLLGVNPYFVKDYLRQAEKISLSSLRQNYDSLLQADRALKGSRLSNRHVMNQFLMKVCLSA